MSSNSSDTKTLYDEYYKKAYEAYENKEYKYSLILLNKLSLDDNRNVNLMVDCSYQYWKSIKIAEEESSIELLNKIKENFTKLLSNTSIPIKAYDYIRLSHIYLAEGSLDGALKIMQLASARGYLEDPTIILQSWTIMRRISNDIEAKGTMTYLTSTLIYEANQRKRDKIPMKQSLVRFTTSLKFITDSTLPQFYLYLHCASFIFKQALHNKDDKSLYKSHMNEFYAILSEAYCIAFSIVNENVKSLYNWFNEVELWLMMGRYLDNGTPFVLLAHDSYWEAFIRAPLDEIAIRLLISSMLKCNRKHDILQLLVQAMEVSPWNIYIRDSIVIIESEIELDINTQYWKMYFKAEHLELAKIQGTYRGWLLKKQWPMIKQQRLDICKLHHERMKLADQMYIKYWNALMKLRISYWKAYIDEWMYKKYISARRIQATWRGHAWYQWYYYWEKPRIYYINNLSIIACQQSYDYTRSFYIRTWHQKYIEKLKHRSAALIINVLYMNGYSILLRKGMDFMLSVIRMKKKYLYQQMFKHWKERFRVRILKKSRVSIRFYIRNKFREKEYKIKLEQLAITEAKMAAKMNTVKYQENNIPLIKEMWRRLRYQYKLIQIGKAKLYIAYYLKKLFYNYKGKKYIRILRLRYENQVSYIYLKWRKKMKSIFIPWRLVTSINRIQRFIRIYQAKKKLIRLQNIKKKLNQLLYKKRIEKLIKIFWKIQKYIYLYKRMKIRASYHIVKLFRLIMKRSLIRNCCKRKIKCGKFLWKLNQVHLKNIFSYIKINTIYVLKINHLNILFDIMKKNILKFHLNYWKKSLKKQTKIDDLINIFINKSIIRKFGNDAYQSISILSLKQYENLQSDNNISYVAQKKITSNQLFRRASMQLKINNPSATDYKSIQLNTKYYIWEKIVSKHLILYDIYQIVIMKAFRSWMIHFRSRKHTLHKVVRPFSIFIINNYIIENGIVPRKLACIMIQNLYRKWKAKNNYRNLIQKYRKFYENHLYMNGNDLHRLVIKLHSIQKNRYQARILLQCLGRKYLAKLKVQKLIQYNEKLMYLESIVDSSRIQRSIVKKYLHMIQTIFCDNIYNRLIFHKQQQQYDCNLNGSINLYPSTAILKTKKSIKKGFRSKYEFDNNNNYNDNDNDDSDDEYLTKNEKIMKKYEKKKRLKQQQLLQKTNQIKLKENNKSILKLKKDLVLFDIDKMKNKSFQSIECHKHLLRLKETGIFIYDDENQHLTTDEIEFCIQHADTIFCQMTGKIDIDLIKNNFNGNKLVLCGGWLTDITVIQVLPSIVCLFDTKFDTKVISSTGSNHIISNRSLPEVPTSFGILPLGISTLPNNSQILTGEFNQEASNSSLCLHITSIQMQLNTKLAFIYAIMDLPSTNIPSSICKCKVRELSIDSDSIGILTITILLRALEFNTTLEVLVIKSTEVYLLPSIAIGIKAISNNASLKDLRFYGAVLGTSILESMIQALQYNNIDNDQDREGQQQLCFQGLISLEFSIDPSIITHTLLAEKIIDLAKNRTYVGRKGLSVTINYR